MNNRLSSMVVMCLAIVFVATAAFAGIAETINYQGRLETSGGVPVNGTVSINFAIYNAPSGGTALWTETQSSVTVTDGAFSVALGSMTPLTPLLFDEPYYLGVAVNGDAEMAPRAALQTVPYAARAAFADDADTLDEMEAAEIIDAASDEVRTPISSVPYTILVPGSYYLTGDLNVTGSDYGITVFADNVTIDLMGFSLIGPGTGSGVGIYMYGRHNVEVRNGTVRSFGLWGISDNSILYPEGHRIINVRVEANGSTGIILYGYNGGHLVKGVTAIGNGGRGMYIINGSTISDCVVANNLDYGIAAGTGNTLKDNIVYKNGNDGIYAPGTGSVVTGNNAYYNDGHGIYVGDSSVVSGNTANNNSSYGIYAYGKGSTVTGNVAYANGGGYGIYAVDGSTMRDNAAYQNSLSGIGCGAACTVTGNSAYENGLSGILAGAWSTIAGNTASKNQQHGIYGGGSCLVDGNTAVNNDKAVGGYANIQCGGCTITADNLAP